MSANGNDGGGGDGEEKVGYGRPPVHSRFKSGKSGNPKGRPKGAKNFQTVIATELGARMQVTENGKRRNIAKRQVIIKQLVNAAVAGDPKATALLINTTRVHEAEAAAAPAQAATRPEDLAVQKGILERLRAADAAPNNTERPAVPKQIIKSDAGAPVEVPPASAGEGDDAVR